jgi:hypothetical protein
MRSECAAVRQDLGVYLLGTIGPADRSALDRHLARCPRCREELAGLAGLPALLQRVPVADAARLADGAQASAGWPPPPEVLAALLPRVARQRRRRRWRLGAATAGLIAAAASAWVLLAVQPAGHQPSTPGRAWTATVAGFSPATRAGATVRYAGRPWGTQLQVHVTGIQAGSTCQFWVTSSTGQHIPTAAWVIVTGRQQVWYPASAPVPVSGLRSFDISRAGKILVTVRVR